MRRPSRSATAPTPHAGTRPKSAVRIFDTSLDLILVIDRKGNLFR